MSKIKVLFVCHGNICRSPMAEFLLKDMVKKEGAEKEFHIASAATSTEEIGNSVHSGTKNILDRHGISSAEKRAVRLEKKDYEKYDYLIGMDQMNIKNMLRITGGDNKGKIFRLLDFTEIQRDIEDSWYTGNFDKTYEDILKGCRGLLEKIKEEKGVCKNQK